MKKVLIITYYWPPAGGVAVQRWLKMSKYLSSYGWQPIILTVSNGSYPYTDESLAKEIPNDIKVYRTKTFEPFEIYNLLRGQKGKAVDLAVATASGKSLFQKVSGYIRANYFLPDARKGWKPYAVKKAGEIISGEKVDAIITTGPPHSTHLIGQVLKARYKLPWIADFRDPWTEIFNNQYLPFTKGSIAKDKQMEASVLRDCDQAVVIGEGMKDAFPTAFRSKMAVITNGYDESDFDRSRQPEKDKFRMRYLGNLFSNQDVPALWTAIATLRKERFDFKQDFELEITGKADVALIKSVEAASIEDCTIFTPFIPHNIAIAKMQTASLLLSIIPRLPNNKLIITGKIFEYIGSGRPVFLIGPPDSDAAVVVRDSERGVVHDYDDAGKMKATLLRYYEQYKNQQDTTSKGNIDRYSRRSLSGKVAEILNKISR